MSTAQSGALARESAEMLRLAATGYAYASSPPSDHQSSFTVDDSMELSDIVRRHCESLILLCRAGESSAASEMSAVQEDERARWSQAETSWAQASDALTTVQNAVGNCRAALQPIQQAQPSRPMAGVERCRTIAHTNHASATFVKTIAGEVLVGMLRLVHATAPEHARAVIPAGDDLRRILDYLSTGQAQLPQLLRQLADLVTEVTADQQHPCAVKLRSYAETVPLFTAALLDVPDYIWETEPADTQAC